MYVTKLLTPESVTQASALLLAPGCLPLERSVMRGRKVSVGAYLAGIPIGLALATLGDDGSAELTFLFVARTQRRVGVGSALLDAIERELASSGCWNIYVRYMGDLPSAPGIESWLGKNGFSEGRSVALFCESDYRTLSRAEWIGLRRPAECAVFPWCELRDQDRAYIEARQQRERWFPEALNPFRNGNEWSEHSLGLRLDGHVQGWFLVRRAAEKRLHVSCMFVDQSLERRALGVALVAEGIRRACEIPGEKYHFEVSLGQKKMVHFVQRRMTPYLTAVHIAKTSQKRLRENEHYRPPASGAIPSAVTTVLVEEHHEAFLVWNCFARGSGSQGRQRATLLHVDSHQDMSLPRLRRPIESITSLDDLADFTYNELNIANFIWPAVYQGLFKRVLWLAPVRNRGVGGWRRISIAARGASATEFVTSDSSRWCAAEAPKSRTIEYAPITVEDDVELDSPTVLDIDLDYFCCNEHPQLRCPEIEITRHEYDKFRRDPYHFLRITPGGKISVAAHDGRYRLVYEDYPARVPLAANWDDIQGRIDGFAAYLDRCRIKPMLIVAARSVRSGYLPREHAALVERAVTQVLASRYPLRIVSVDELLGRIPVGAGAAGTGGIDARL
jgi:GNAT superfamily N-acetyltransferase